MKKGRQRHKVSPAHWCMPRHLDLALGDRAQHCQQVKRSRLACRTQTSKNMSRGLTLAESTWGCCQLICTESEGSCVRTFARHECWIFFEVEVVAAGRTAAGNFSIWASGCCTVTMHRLLCASSTLMPSCLSNLVTIPCSMGFFNVSWRRTLFRLDTDTTVFLIFAIRDHTVLSGRLQRLSGQTVVQRCEPNWPRTDVFSRSVDDKNRICNGNWK
jgi:hypothetical protein